MAVFHKLLVLVLLSLVSDALGQSTVPTSKASTPPSTVGPSSQSPASTPASTVGPSSQSPASTPASTVTPGSQSPASTPPSTVGPSSQSPASTPASTVTPSSQSPASTVNPSSPAQASTVNPSSPTQASTVNPSSPTQVTDPVKPTTAYELPTDGITLICGHDFMEVQIPISLLTDGAEGDDLIFEKSNCTGVKEVINETECIILTTNLIDCETKRSEDDTHEVYSNMVVNNEIGTISRQYKVEIPINCSYSRSGEVSQAWYQLTDYVLDKDLEEDGEYSFDLKFYGDSSFTQPIDGFPYLVDLDEELYFAASLGSKEYNDLDLSIKSCKATHGEDYNGPQQYDLITDWEVAVGEMTKTSISCFSGTWGTDDDNTDTIRVTTHAFRFILEGDQDGVYIHCDLFVCDDSDDDSECKDQCTNNTDPTRRKRDVSLNSPPLPIQRLTRGPIRFRRAAPVFNAPEQMEIQIGDNPGVQAASTPLTMWALIVVVMGSVVIVLLAALIVTLRKLVTTKKSTTTRKDDEAHVGLINDSD